MNSKELAELIHQNTRIILPEFGAFLVKDNGEKEFNPNNVSFSPFLRYNDGMLEVFIAKSRGISKEEAAKDVHDFVETVKNELLEKGVFQIEGLGLLKRDQRGSLSFALTRSDENKNQAEISSPKTPISKKKPQIENITPEEVSGDRKDFWLEADKPIEETEIPTKKTRKIGESKAKVEKLSVTKKTAQSSKIDDEAKQEPIQEIVEPLVEAKDEPQKDSIPTPEPLIIATPKPIIETKPTEKALDIEDKKDKRIDYEKHTYPEEPTTDEVKKRMGLAGFVCTGIAVAVIVVLVLILKNYYFPPNVESINDNLSTSKTPENILKNKVEAKDKIDKPKDDIEKVYNELDADKKDKPVKTQEQLKKEKAQEEAIKNNLIKNSQITSVAGNKFYIIAGCFKKPAFAEKYLNELKKSGYNPTIVIQPSGMNAVTIGSYNSREDANKAMKKFKEKLPDLWILKK